MTSISEICGRTTACLAALACAFGLTAAVHADGVRPPRHNAAGIVEGYPNVTLTIDPTRFSGGDASGRPLLYSPNDLAPGSSLSHWDVQAYPNLLMEPALNTSLHDETDLARQLFEDIGWLPRVTPFGLETRIPFALERGAHGDLAVFDLSGRRVKRLASGWLEAGPHVLSWDGTDDEGRRMAPGVYFYRFTSGGFAGARQMVMLSR